MDRYVRDFHAASQRNRMRFQQPRGRHIRCMKRRPPAFAIAASVNANVRGIDNGTSAAAGLSTLAAFAIAGSAFTLFAGAGTGAEGNGIAVRGSVFLAIFGDTTGTALFAATTGSSFGAAAM